MDEKKIDETLYTRKCQNCGMVNSFVITKKGIETMANRLGYRKESDTAREILECLRFLIEERNCVGGYDLEDETIDGTIFVEILNELKERYGVEVE